MSHIPEFTDLRRQYRARLETCLESVPAERRQEVIAEFQKWLEVLSCRIGMVRSARAKLAMLQPLTVADDFAARYERRREPITTPVSADAAGAEASGSHRGIWRRVNDRVIAFVKAIEAPLTAGIGLATVVILIAHWSSFQEQAYSARLMAMAAFNQFKVDLTVSSATGDKLETFNFPPQSTSNSVESVTASGPEVRVESDGRLGKMVDAKKCSPSDGCRFAVTVTNDAPVALPWPTLRITMLNEDGSPKLVTGAVIVPTSQCIPSHESKGTGLTEDAKEQMREFVRSAKTFRLVVSAEPQGLQCPAR